MVFVAAWPFEASWKLGLATGEGRLEPARFDGNVSLQSLAVLRPMFS